MVAEQTQPELTYSGTDEQKSLAETMFQLMRAQGMFASDYAPIRVRIETFAQHLDRSEDDIRAVVEANADIFAIESDTIEIPVVKDVTNGDDEAEEGEEPAEEPEPEVEHVTWVVSTRLGTPPIEMVPDTRHSFAERLMTPEPAPERPLRTERPVPGAVTPTEVGAAIGDALEDEFDVAAALRREGVEPGEDIRVELVTPERAEPVETPTEVAETPEPAVEIEAPAEVESEPQLEPEPAAEEPAEAPVDVVETVAEAPEPEPTSGLTDLSDLDDETVAAAIREALQSDPRAANFANQWMAEERVERLSRGNLRSLADYINEQEQPLTDDMLVQDVLGVRRNSGNFETMRFAMNYRLSSERNFEFLGTADQPFWGTTDLPPIGTTRRKASDIGTDYRFLVEEAPLGSVEPRSVKTVEHTLSFYEFTYGLLPLDADMQALLPAPMMPEQRSAVLMVEIPQFENSVYLVEVRYPTHNRGGFILGLDDFYEEKLVPGAMLSIEATDNDGQYKIEYLEDDEKQDRFLELDDRRAPKYVFRPLSYDTAVDDDWLVTETRFPQLGNEKPLAERQRRRIESVIEETFTRVGEQDGDLWYATFTDLLVAVNVERPASETVVRNAIDSMASVSDDGSGMLTYDASA